MNLERFTLIVESYGADSQQWPRNERAEALEFSSTSIAVSYTHLTLPTNREV